MTADPRIGPLREELRRFLGDAPLIFGLFAVMAAGFTVWEVARGEPVAESLALGAAVLFAAPMMLPLLWLRHWRGYPVRSDVRRWVALFGLALLWWALWIGAIAGALALADALGAVE